MNGRVSIAMTTFNGENFLKEQLESILNQTRTPDELVICDDGSTDSTVNIVKLFSGLAPFKVRFYQNKKNIGYTSNFSKALSLCNFDYIFLCDQDDVWYHNKIARSLEFLSQYPDKQLLIHDLDYCDKDLNSIGQTKINRIKSYYDPMDKYVTGMATVIRSDFLNICLPIPVQPNITHDNWLHRCANYLNVKIILPEVLSLYRRHDQSATTGSKLNVVFKAEGSHFKESGVFKNLVSDTLIDLKKNIIINSESKKWIEEKSAIIQERGLADKSIIQKVLDDINFKLCINKKRQEIISLNRYKRVLPIIRNILRGGYADYNGINSAIKDMFFN